MPDLKTAKYVLIGIVVGILLTVPFFIGQAASIDSLQSQLTAAANVALERAQKACNGGQ